MALTTDELSNLLTTLAALDTHHATQSQEKFAQKIDAWALILEDVDYQHALAAVQRHYLDPNAKAITPALVRQMAIRSAPAPRSSSSSPDDVARRERACNSPTCRCTHLECWNGFLDEETTIERDGRSHVAVKPCPTCRSALEARTAGL